MKTIKTTLFLSALLALVFGINSCKKNTDDHVENSGGDQISKHINDSLWAYYPLNGNTNDSSGHNHALILKNGAKLVYDTWGNDVGALDFDGINDYAVIPDGSLFPSTSFSVSLFVMPRANKGLFFGKQDFNSGKAASFNVGIDNPIHGDVARFSITTNQSQICDQIPAGGDVVLNNRTFYSYAWYNVVITFDKGIMKFYINGNMVGSKQIDIQQINSCQNGQFILGSWWKNDLNAFNGKIDDLRVYTRAISEQEVKHLFDIDKE